MNDTIQVRYDELEDIANSFTRQADDLKTAMDSLNSCVEELRDGGFKGVHARKFFNEMDCDTSPALKRLDAALRNASIITGGIKTIFETAEQDSSTILAQSNIETN